MKILRVFSLILCVILGVATVADAHPSAAQTSRIEYNETVHSNIDENANEERWQFTGHTGDLILIDMRADGSNLDSYLSLLDPFGNPLASDDDGGEGLNARIGPYRLPSDGIYTILAGRYSGAGSYLLQLKNLNTIPTITIGKPLAGVLDSGHTTDYFLLPAVAGDALWQLSVSDDQANTDPYLALYGPSGLLTSTEYDGGSRIDPVVALPDQTYVAVVSWNPGSTGGPYQLDLSLSTVDLLNNGVPQTGTLSYDVLHQRHYFRGEAGQSVRLSRRRHCPEPECHDSRQLHHPVFQHGRSAPRADGHARHRAEWGVHGRGLGRLVHGRQRLLHDQLRDRPVGRACAVRNSLFLSDLHHLFLIAVGIRLPDKPLWHGRDLCRRRDQVQDRRVVAVRRRVKRQITVQSPVTAPPRLFRHQDSEK
jgi:hypothetical protein